jgi:hypothetical protein
MKKETPLGLFQRSGAAVLKTGIWKQPLPVTGALVLAAVLMFGACSLFTSGGDNAAVSAVVVSPVTSTVAKGGTQTFTAAVAGIGNYDRTVTWTVGGGGAGTAISGAGVLTVAAGETAASLTVTATSTMDTSKSGTAAVTVTGGDDPVTERARQFRDELNAIAQGSVEVDNGNSTYVNVINSLTLTTDVSVPAGVGLILKNGKTLTVPGGSTLDLTGGGLILENNTTLTVNGTVNAKASTGLTSLGIAIMPGSTSVTINGSGIIHLKTQGTLLYIMATQKLTLKGTVTLDGLRTVADGGTDAGDTMNNVGHVVFVAGEMDMQGGTITGNYNTADYDGGGVEVNGEDGVTAMFTMSGNAKVSGNRAAHGGGGVNVVHNATFTMKDNAEVSDNTAGDGGGGVRVNQGTYPTTSFTMQGNATVSGNTAGTHGGGVWVRDGGVFTLEGGTIYGSASADANTATYGDSLYVQSGTAKWGASVTTTEIGGISSGSSNGNIISSGNAVDNTIHAVSP